MVDLFEQCRMACDELIDIAGRAAIQAVLELTAQQVAGPRQPARPVRPAGAAEDQRRKPPKRPSPVDLHERLPGRKSDVQECQWLLKLHAFGLLNNSFQPTDEIRIARTLWRQRGNLVAEASTTIQRMQKVLTEMNVQLSNVLSDLSGVSGMNILQAILDGERDPWELAAWVEAGVKATPEDIAKSLEGNWREELLFVLRQHVELYRIYQKKIDDCDLQLRKHLESLGAKVDLPTQPIGPRPKGKNKSRNAPAFDLRTELYRITGIDSSSKATSRCWSRRAKARSRSGSCIARSSRSQPFKDGRLYGTASIPVVHA